MSANLIGSEMIDVDIILKLNNNINIDNIYEWLKDKYFIVGNTGQYLVIKTVLHYYDFGFSDSASNYLDSVNLDEFTRVLREISLNNTIIINSRTPQSLNLAVYLNSQGFNVGVNNSSNVNFDVKKILKHKLIVLNPKSSLKTLLDVFNQTPIIIGKYVYFTTNNQYLKVRKNDNVETFLIPFPFNVLVKNVYNVLLRKVFFNEVKYLTSKRLNTLIYIHDISLKGREKLFHMVVDEDDSVGILLYDGVKNAWHSIIVEDYMISGEDYGCGLFLDFVESRVKKLPKPILNLNCFRR